MRNHSLCPVLFNNSKMNANQISKISYIAFAGFLGIFLFFQDPNLANFLRKGSEDWYVNFSVMIFHPNEAYWNESILLPLIGKLLGASRSLEGYKILCAFISALILPILAILSLSYFKKISSAIIFLLLFAFSFRYLWSYDLGHPDPLTILCLIALPFIRSTAALFSLSFLAALSHFSMAGIAILEIIILYLASKEFLFKKWEYPISLILGLLSGRVFLSIWYFIFHYTSPHGRLEFIYNSGYIFFLDQYQKSPERFWLTPGILFLLIYGGVILSSLYKGNLKYPFGILLTLSLSYLALFLTVDGLRVFAVVSCGAYIFLLLRFLQPISKQINDPAQNRG